MYLSQIINVNLTPENTEILKRPSKLFNKLKSVFSGEMTPTQKLRAEIMLSVLQRLNIALRRSDFVNLSTVIANEQVIFESSNDKSSDVELSESVVTESLQNTEIKQLDSLGLTVEGIKHGLRFLINVNILRRAVKQNTPVKIQIFGFIDEFRQLSGESAEDFSQRVKQEIAKSWGSESEQKNKLDTLEVSFLKETEQLQDEVNQLFPAHSESEESKKVLRKEAMKSRFDCHSRRYDDSFAYLPIWFLYMQDTHGEMYYEGQEGVYFDNEQAWDDSARYGAGADSNSWVDDMSDSSFGDSGGDGGASCGGGCGGGCGGA